MIREQVFVAVVADTKNKQWSAQIVTPEERISLSEGSPSSDAKQLEMEALIAPCKVIKRPSAITFVTEDNDFVNLMGYRFKPEKGGSYSLAAQYKDVRDLCRSRHRIHPVVGEPKEEFKRWDTVVGYHPECPDLDP